MVESRFLEFKIDYSSNKDLGAGHSVSSEVVSTGGHQWRVDCYPSGDTVELDGEYASIFLRLVSDSSDAAANVRRVRVRAIFEAFLLNRDGRPSSTHAKRCVHVFQPETPWGWARFVRRSDVDALFVANGGLVTFMCGVIVVSAPDDDVPVPPPPPPPSDIGLHLGRLLDRSVGADVTFLVGGEAFPAHRAVLAARSPVFEAQLLGAMVDARAPSITVQDVEPAAFRAMLHSAPEYVYTDSLPADAELVGDDSDADDSLVAMMQHLVATADRYALDRVKAICSLKLIEKVAEETVGDILVCAETHGCPVLKKRCLDFFAVENNFKKAAFTDGFLDLVQKYPSLSAELRRRVGI